MKTLMEIANHYIEGKITLPIPYPYNFPNSSAEFEELIKKEREKEENRETAELIFSSDSIKKLFPEKSEENIPKGVWEKKRQAKLNASLITNTGTDRITFIEAIQEICRVKALENLKLQPITKEKIFIALWEFFQAMILPYEIPKLQNKLVVEMRRKTIDHLEKVLIYPFLDESFKEKTLEELHRLKEYDENRLSDDPIKGLDYIVTLYAGGMVRANIDMLQTPIEIKEGRPSKPLFLELLKIIVFKELDKAGIKTSTAPLTAKIINEFKEKHGSFIAQIVIEVYIQNQVPDFAKTITEVIKDRLSKIPHLDTKDIHNAFPKIKKP